MKFNKVVCEKTRHTKTRKSTFFGKIHGNIILSRKPEEFIARVWGYYVGLNVEQNHLRSEEQNILIFWNILDDH